MMLWGAELSMARGWGGARQTTRRCLLRRRPLPPEYGPGPLCGGLPRLLDLIQAAVILGFRLIITPSSPPHVPMAVRARHSEGGVLLEARHGDMCREDVAAVVNAANERLSHGGGIAKAIAEQAGCDGVVQKESAEWVQKNGPVHTGRVAAITSAGNLPCKFVVHVAGPIWSKAVAERREIEVKGEIVSVNADGAAILMAPECGSVQFGVHRCAPDYVPTEGDRVRACVSKEAPAPPGGKGRKGGATGGGGYKARFVTGIKHVAPASDEDLLAGAAMAALRKADEAECDSVALPAISSGLFGFPLPLCAHILVKAGRDFVKEKPKFVKRITFTNNDTPTVTAFVNEFISAFGPESVVAEAVAAASQAPTNQKGIALSGPLLVDVDAQGNVIAKAPCPKTTSANVAKMKADGYLFHSSGPWRNNWVRGIPAPGEPVVQTFDPRGDWSTSRHGVSRGVPGMEEPPMEGGSKAKKKKKKPKAGGVAEEGEEADGAEPPNGVEQSQSTVPAEKTLSTPDDVNKRIKAVNKKLMQARDLAAAASDGSKELNVDQKLKVDSIPAMEEELAQLDGLLASLSV